MAYLDTDSAVLVCPSADLRELLRPEYVDRHDEVAEFLFGKRENDGALDLLGKFKLEGKVATSVVSRRR